MRRRPTNCAMSAALRKTATAFWLQNGSNCMRTKRQRCSRNCEAQATMKRQPIKALLVLLSAALFAQAAGQPNMIFILSDDLAQGDVGCYGQKLIQTPNLDRMAREGTRFTQ